jgi:hypothetical protein
METQPLFLDSKLRFGGEEKLAGMLTRLGDNTDTWPQEITQEAYKQLPFLSDFEPNVVLDKVDEERGFAFGSIEVRPKTAMTMEEQHTSSIEKVHIPIVVKEHMLSPFDVFLHGKDYQHLTEGRIRGALFRPESFDAARTRPYDPSMVHDLQPPIRAGYGGFGSGGVKTGSIEELQVIPLLPQLHGRVRQDHLDRLKEACADPSLRAQVTNGHEGVLAAFNSAIGLEPADLEKTANLLANRIRPTVVQFRKLENGKVMMKWANAEMYAPQSEELPMDVVQDIAGEQDMSTAFEADGTFTASPDAPVKETMEAEEVKVADSFGLWKVQDTNGNSMIGWVFPNVLSMDMKPLPLALFNNGSQYALQEHIAGEMAGKSTDLPKGTPKGYGCLYYIDHGTAKAFLPMTVSSTMRGPDGMVRYVASDDLGESCNFYFSDAMKSVVKVGPNDYCVPAMVNWMPLRGKSELVSEPLAFSKTSSSRVATAELIGDGDVFDWRGPAVAKLAHDQTKSLKRHDAEFLGVALGIHPQFVKKALDQVSRGGAMMSYDNLKVITPLHEKHKEAHAKVRKDLDELEVPIHNYFLAKEASILNDALTADKILGLGFLNAENVASFVDMLPSLEACSSKLAELLVAVRVGMEDIPEVAVERMLAAMEDVIRGLKSLRQKELTHMA